MTEPKARSLLFGGLLIFLSCFEIGTAGTDDNHSFMYSDTCGEVLHTNYGGKISYKPGEPVGIYEKCMWIIRFESSDKINFTLTQGSYSAKEDSVNVVALLRPDNSSGLEVTHAFLKNPGSQVLPGSLALVTFGTFGNATTPTKYGFELEFYGNLAPTPVRVSSRSFNIMEFEFEGNITVPEPGVKHDAGEMSIIVFPTPEFTYVPSSFASLEFFPKGQGCGQKLFIYSYSSVWPPMLWKSLCSTESYSCGSVTSSFFFLVFVSDDEHANAGDAFEIGWRVRYQ